MTSAATNIGAPTSVLFLRILRPYDPAIALLGIYLKELKTHVPTKTCPQQV
jgi:hypothetical protein